METRRGNSTQAGKIKGSPLPVDFLKMVTEVFSTTFDAGLKALAKNHDYPATFTATGTVFNNEIVLAVSLKSKASKLAATTAYASCDFDPKASSPTAQDLLGACVDALGALFEQLLNPKNKSRLQQIADDSLSAMEDVPFEWTLVEVERYKIHVKLDKANPELDQAADEWLAKNDPDLLEREKREHEETEKLFVTGPKKKTDRGDLH